jgi:hypothetical protein
MSRWPRDNQADLIRFYGTPGPEVEAQLIPVTPPFKMYYEGKPIKSIRFHRKAAGALAAALEDIWQHYDCDQEIIDSLGISKYAGAYNPRKIRGSQTKWSNHAYGAAIDLNAEENGFGKGKGTIPQPVIDAFKRQGARWGGDYSGRTDPMHFEFCDAGQAVGLMAIDEPMVDGDQDLDGPQTPPDVPAIGDDLSSLNPKEGFFDKAWKLAKSKTQWSASGISIASVVGLLTDWRVVSVLVVGGLAAYIIYERSKKP